MDAVRRASNAIRYAEEDERKAERKLNGSNAWRKPETTSCYYKKGDAMAELITPNTKWVSEPKLVLRYTAEPGPVPELPSWARSNMLEINEHGYTLALIGQTHRVRNVNKVYNDTKYGANIDASNQQDAEVLALTGSLLPEEPTAMTNEMHEIIGKLSKFPTINAARLWLRHHPDYVARIRKLTYELGRSEAVYGIRDGVEEDPTPEWLATSLHM